MGKKTVSANCMPLGSVGHHLLYLILNSYNSAKRKHASQTGRSSNLIFLNQIWKWPLNPWKGIEIVKYMGHANKSLKETLSTPREQCTQHTENMTCIVENLED